MGNHHPLKKLLKSFKKHNVMKKQFIIFLMGFILSSSAIAAQQTASKTTKQEINAKVEVYYFHGDRRCKTCKAVGAIAKDFLIENYSKEMEARSVYFHDINYDLEENKELAEKMQVSGSSLIVKKSSKTEISTKDLTNLAFMYALTNPQKLKNAIQKEIDSII